VQSSWYHPVGRHVLGIHGFAGALFGDAPYFERFFVGDLNLLLPPRALGLNFSTLSSRDFLGTSVGSHRYDSFAARLLVEYAVPLWRRRGFFYRGDAFAAFGAFALASLDDLRVRDTGPGPAIPADLTADLGLRLDTYVGIFTLSVANALGRIPF
jgi:outer membrane protein insertion porin family